MQDQIDQYTAEINAFSPANADELETFRIKFLGTKGIIKDLFEQFKTVGPDEKRTFGKVLNQFKQLAEAKYLELQEKFKSEIENPKSEITKNHGKNYKIHIDLVRRADRPVNTGQGIGYYRQAAGNPGSN